MKNISFKKGTFELLIIIASFFFLFPFVLLGFYNHPLGIHEWDWITNLGGQLSDNGLLEKQYYFYKNVMGRYSSTFISSLTPYLYSILSFKLFFVVNIIFSYLIFFIFYRFFFNIKSKLRILAISSISWIMWVSAIAGIYDTLYMLTSVHTYLLGFYGFVFLMLSWKFLFLDEDRKIIFKVLIVAFTVFCIGTNEITMFFTFILNIVVIFKNRSILIKDKAFVLILLTIIFIFVLIAILSPANFSRHQSYTNNTSYIYLFLLSTYVTFFNLSTWVVNGNVILGFLLILTVLSTEEVAIPRFFNIDSKYLTVALILLVLFGDFLLVFSTKGMSLAERVVDHILSFFIIFSSIIIVKYFSESFQFKALIEIIHNNTIIKFLLLVAFIASSLGQGLYLDREGGINKNYFSLIKSSSNVGNAWLGILDNTVHNYDKEMTNQYNQLKVCKSDTCFVEKPIYIHDFLYFEKGDRRNKYSGDPFMGYYFNKKIKSVKYK